MLLRTHVHARLWADGHGRDSKHERGVGRGAFWQDDVGYTYEGVYGLFAKLKRKFYQKSVPWASKGKIDTDAPCADEWQDIAVIFESEEERLIAGNTMTSSVR